MIQSAFLLFFLSTQVLAADFFIKKGEIASFDYQPHSYDSLHSINYYLPKNYTKESRYQLLILLHGGGASTASYESSKRVAQFYMKDFTKYADANDTIIVAPGSGIGWSYITRILLSELFVLMKKDLSFNTNKVVLFGHSMGGMGITREAHWLVDYFTGVMPTAAGMQDHFREKSHYLKTYFNIPFVHINGEHDHFDVFKPRSLRVQKDIKEVLEPQYKMKSKFQLIFHSGGHNYNLKQVYDELSLLFERQRDLYQKNLFPLFQNLQVKDSPWGPDTQYSLNRYYWLRVKFKEGTFNQVVHGTAKIENNIIELDLENQQALESIEILLSNRQVDFSKEVTIKLNGSIVKKGVLQESSDFTQRLIKQEQDPNFIFESSVVLQ